MGRGAWWATVLLLAAKSHQSCPTLWDSIDGSLVGSLAWDFPGKNTGVGCHFLLQCMKLKSESEVAQSCLTRGDPMDCSPLGSSVHGIFQARGLEWGAIAFSVLQSMESQKATSKMAPHSEILLVRHSANYFSLHKSRDVFMMKTKCFFFNEKSLFNIIYEKNCPLSIPRHCAQSLSHVWLWNLMDYSPPRSSVHGVFQARILKWVANPFWKGSSWPRDRLDRTAGGFFSTEPPGKPRFLGRVLTNRWGSCTEEQRGLFGRDAR